MNVKDTEDQLNRMKNIYSYIKDENPASNESIITILGKNFHDEDLISNYLSYILDPYVNGIGYQPLYALLDIINIPFDPENIEHVDIQREYTLPNNRRIDFLITLNNEHVLAIEHKVFSGEHGKQTIEYECELRKLYNSLNSEKKDTVITFVFLTPHGKDPLNSNFIPVSYSQVVPALKRIPVDFTKDVRKAVIFHEFISHLEGYFLHNQKLELSKKSTLYLENLKVIEDLKNHFDSDYTNVFNYIETVIKNYFTPLNKQENKTQEDKKENYWKFDFKEGRSYHQIYKPNWKTNNLDIHFELSLSKASLAKQHLTFRLDIEKPGKNYFEDNHGESIVNKLHDHLTSNDIMCKKTHNKNWGNSFAFAKKTYPILSPEQLSDEAKLKSSLEEMLKEFDPFIQVIDEELKHYQTIRK